MNNFEHAHNQYLEPPDDDPVCEDGCGQPLIHNPFSDGWFCNNKFCPTKFSGVEKEMAETLVEFMDYANTYKKRYEQARTTLTLLKEQIEELKWKIRGNNK